MNGYLGEEIVNEENFKNRTQEEWALRWIFQYGQIDGGHHKAWLIDQVTRILNGTPVIVKLAKWENGHKEYRYELDEPSEKYIQWVKDYQEMDEEGNYEYGYDEGIAP